MIPHDRFPVMIEKSRFEQKTPGPYYVRAGGFYQIRNLNSGFFPGGPPRRELESEKN
jgi:hypothetical protein